MWLGGVEMLGILSTHFSAVHHHIGGLENSPPSLSGVFSEFLSHLCGGEQKGSASFISDVFLSHLCGGELFYV
jgi:hypothetical protein